MGGNKILVSLVAFTTAVCGFRVRMKAGKTEKSSGIPCLEQKWRTATSKIDVVAGISNNKDAGAIKKGVKFAVLAHLVPQKRFKVAVPIGDINLGDVGLMWRDLSAEDKKFWSEKDMRGVLGATYVVYVREEEYCTGRCQREEEYASKSAPITNFQAIIAEIHEMKQIAECDSTVNQALDLSKSKNKVSFGGRNGRWEMVHGQFVMQIDRTARTCAITVPPVYRNQTDGFRTDKTIDLLAGSYFGAPSYDQGDPNLVVTTQASTGSPDVGARYSDDLKSWSVPAVFRNSREDKEGKPTAYSSHALQVMHALIGSERGMCGWMPEVFSYFTIANDGMRAVLANDFGGDHMPECKRDTDGGETSHDQASPIKARDTLSDTKCTARRDQEVFNKMYRGNPLGKLAGTALSSIFGPEGPRNWEVTHVMRWMLGTSNEVSFLVKDHKCGHRRKFSCETGQYTACAD